MSHNTFGHLFRVKTFGESHGPLIGCVIDGCPPLIPLNETNIQPALDRRKPGGSKFVTQRREDDQARIVSGVFEGQTTGTPIAILIDNTDQRSKDYGDIANAFRPGHADYTYTQKYGIRDYRGGGRSSARETAMRVAAGAVATQVLTHLLGDGFAVRGAMVQLGDHGINRDRFDWNAVDQNPFFCPDAESVSQWETYLDGIRKSGSSIGAVVEVEAMGVPVGLGAPLYGKLDAEIASALMSINAVKGVEIGTGFGVAKLSGEQNADEMRDGSDGPVFLSNHAGGILGGISTGQTIVARMALKPTSSILTPRRTINEAGQEVELMTKGRHDPCVGIRAVPVAEAMLSCVVLDAYLRHRGQCG